MTTRNRVRACLIGLSVVGLALSAHAQPKAKPKPDGDKPLPPKEPACKLLTTELPRGGRLEIQVDDTGKAPVVRVGGKVARMLQRTEQRVAAQVPRKSDGGPVTLQRGKERLSCGSLTIIGLEEE